MSEKVKGTKIRYSLCNLDAVYAIFSLEKVWQSHDFMHIFSDGPAPIVEIVTMASDVAFIS